MTKKDYVLIAGAIAQEMREADAGAAKAIDGVIDRLCFALKRENARFDSARFKAAAWCEG